MPIISKFVIERLKGKERVEIDMEAESTGPVLTITGLNESGETTILETLSHFVSGDRSVASFFDGPYATASVFRVIPKHLKAALTEKVEIQANVSLNHEDLEELSAIAKRHKLLLDTGRLRAPIKVTREFSFEDSELRESTNRWIIQLYSKGPEGKMFTAYKRPTQSTEDSDLWLDCVKHIETKLLNRPQLSRHQPGVFGEALCSPLATSGH